MDHNGEETNRLRTKRTVDGEKEPSETSELHHQEDEEDDVSGSE